jgi:hypothetical protein
MRSNQEQEEEQSTAKFIGRAVIDREGPTLPLNHERKISIKDKPTLPLNYKKE